MRYKRNLEAATFELYGEELVAKGVWNPGYPDTREEPGEPAGWELDSIAYSAHPEVNFINHVSDETIGAAEDALDEAHAVAVDNSYDERERRDEEIDNA
jgi:hypothetical protein